MKSKEIIIEKCSATALELEKDRQIKIDQTHGTQIAGFLAIGRQNPSEKFSQDNTRLSLALGPYRRPTANGTIPYWIEKGDILVSNRWNPMLTIIEDTYGKHDIIFDPCDSYFNVKIMGQKEGHPGCRGLHAEALKPWGIGYDDIAGGVNLFQNTLYREDGMQVFPTKTGDDAMIIFQANMDLVISVTACPFPLGENRPIHMEIF